MTVLVILWAAPVAAAVVAATCLARARRTRSQVADVLARLPELAGERRAGTADLAAAWAAALSPRFGADPVATAAATRLAHVPPDVITESGIGDRIARLVRDAEATPRGQARQAAAVVRVVSGCARRLGDPGWEASGALFRTVVDHPVGDERRVAEALVHLVQGGPSSA